MAVCQFICSDIWLVSRALPRVGPHGSAVGQGLVPARYTTQQFYITVVSTETQSCRLRLPTGTAITIYSSPQYTVATAFAFHVGQHKVACSKVRHLNELWPNLVSTKLNLEKKEIVLICAVMLGHLMILPLCLSHFQLIPRTRGAAASKRACDLQQRYLYLAILLNYLTQWYFEAIPLLAFRRYVPIFHWAYVSYR